MGAERLQGQGGPVLGPSDRRGSTDAPRPQKFRYVIYTVQDTRCGYVSRVELRIGLLSRICPMVKLTTFWISDIGSPQPYGRIVCHRQWRYARENLEVSGDHGQIVFELQLTTTSLGTVRGMEDHEFCNTIEYVEGGHGYAGLRGQKIAPSENQEGPVRTSCYIGSEGEMLEKLGRRSTLDDLVANLWQKRSTAR